LPAVIPSTLYFLLIGLFAQKNINGSWIDAAWAVMVIVPDKKIADKIK
jgi:hypothetical protein